MLGTKRLEIYTNQQTRKVKSLPVVRIGYEQNVP
jgi:hypothetical protein